MAKWKCLPDDVKGSTSRTRPRKAPMALRASGNQARTGMPDTLIQTDLESMPTDQNAREEKGESCRTGNSFNSQEPSSSISKEINAWKESILLTVKVPLQPQSEIQSSTEEMSIEVGERLPTSHFFSTSDLISTRRFPRITDLPFPLRIVQIWEEATWEKESFWSDNGGGGSRLDWAVVSNESARLGQLNWKLLSFERPSIHVDNGLKGSVSDPKRTRENPWCFLGSFALGT